jgi:hypothetical protein
MVALHFPASQFRSIPAPTGKAKIGLFFTEAASVPAELFDWRDVNPREVKRTSSVYGKIVRTLTEDPERFHERNRGMTIVAEDLAFDEKRKEVILKLRDTKQHGVVDGAHTLDAILETQKEPPENGWPAYVFVKALTGVEPDQIAEIAGGLNTSEQVDLKSLENLRDHFAQLEKVLEKESYATKIAYKMFEAKPVDVREVLYYLAVFDCSEWNEKSHPVRLFGRKEGIVRQFADQAAKKKDAGDSFRILITKAPEILWLRDMIEKRAVALPIGRFKAGKGTRVRSESHRQNDLVFLDEKVNGKIPLGWIMPILAAFRANVEWNKPKGSFSWTVPIDELLDTCIEKLVLAIQDVHEQENSRPEYVGRNSIAWRMTYNIVSQAILESQLAEARRR